VTGYSLPASFNLATIEPSEWLRTLVASILNFNALLLVTLLLTQEHEGAPIAKGYATGLCGLRGTCECLGHPVD